MPLKVLTSPGKYTVVVNPTATRHIKRKLSVSYTYESMPQKNSGGYIPNKQTFKSKTISND